MPNPATQILLIEDNPGDTRLIQEHLSEVQGAEFAITCADRLAAGLALLEQRSYDLVLLDLSLPDSAGLETFVRLHQQAGHRPIIVLTGLDDEATAFRAVRSGAQDYLVKGAYDGKLLSRAIRYAIERKRVEEQLKASQQRYEKAAIENAQLYERARQEIQERRRAEDQLRLTQFTVDHVADNVLWMQPDGRLTYANHAACAALGYPPQELLASSFQALIDGSGDLADWPKTLDLVRRAGSATLEGQFRRKNGQTFPVEIILNHIQFDDQELLCAIGRDITDRKRTEEQLRHQAESLDQSLARRTLELAGERIRTRTILEALGEAVIVSDKEQRIQYVNQAAIELTGFSRSELLGQRMHLWRSARHTSELSPEGLETPMGNRTWRGEVSSQRKDGNCFEAAVTLAPLHDPEESSQPIGYVSIQRDISKLKEAERVKYRFVSNVSHELRTPLSILTMMADNLYALYGQLDDQKRRKLAGDIRDHTLSLNELVTSVLEISRIDSGEVAYTRDLLDLAEIAQDEVDKLIPLAGRKDQALGAQGDGRLMVQGNAGQLRQVIRNLLNNALKYTPEGGEIRCELLVLKERENHHGVWPGRDALPGGAWAGMRVIDTGLGIATEHLPYIFDRFYRVDSQGSVPGAGLGLSIAKELVELHGGLIAVDSTLNQGSVFALYLPLVVEPVGAA